MRRLSPLSSALSPLLFSTALLIAWLTGPPTLSDPAGAPLPPGLHLTTPWLYFVFGPLFSLWDGVSMLSMSRLRALPIGLAAIYVLWRVARLTHSRDGSVDWKWYLRREVGLAMGAVAGFGLFVLIGAVWHRPMIRLTGTPADIMVVDLHSHTNASHDVKGLMRGFDAEALRRWHRRAGFDAAFITDHNTVASLGASADGRSRPVLCHGIEVSAWQAHIILLGDTVAIDPDPYRGSLEGVLALLSESRTRYGSLAIASIPEYERNHWNNLGRFIAAGLAGFEVVNASPKANEITQARRDTVIALAKAHDLLVDGVSDSHGWGATSMVWSLARVPGWQQAGSATCRLLLERLRTGGFAGLQVVERHRLRPDSRWPLWLTPIGLVWETWRGMPGRVATSWLVWIWAVWLLRRNGARTRRFSTIGKVGGS